MMKLPAYLAKILRKEAGDKSGLIYGMGHAIYTLSDPMSDDFERAGKKLSAQKG